MLRFKNLGSGSTGNATVVEGRSGSQVRRLLIDCGLGIRQLQARLALAQLQVEDLDALFITHEHSDHIGCAQTLALRFRIPVWMSEGTYAALGAPGLDGLLRVAHDMEAINMGAFEARPFTVPHDAREPLQLRCSDGAAHLGVLTDLGHASPHVLQQLQGCHALMIEANHDPDMLAASRYPPFLKRRVGGAVWPPGQHCNRRDPARGAARRPAACGGGAPECAEQPPRPCPPVTGRRAGVGGRGDPGRQPHRGDAMVRSGPLMARTVRP